MTQQTQQALVARRSRCGKPDAIARHWHPQTSGGGRRYQAIGLSETRAMRCGEEMGRLYQSIAVTQRPKIGHFGTTGAILKWFGHQWPLVAPNRLAATSDMSPLLGAERT